MNLLFPPSIVEMATKQENAHIDNSKTLKGCRCMGRLLVEMSIIQEGKFLTVQALIRIDTLELLGGVMKKQDKALINVNFLEFPMWKVDGKDERTEFEIKTEHGTYLYKANSKEGAPESADMVFLHTIMREHQNTLLDTIYMTPYECCKKSGYSLNKYRYDRLKKSLKRWLDVTITFDGNFYDGENTYTEMGFHILKYKKTIVVSKTGREREVYVIELDKDFLNVANKLGMFLDTEEFKSIKSPLGRRLYEFLPKHFLKNSKYKIGVDKLFPKLTIKKAKYPSEIKRQINSISRALKEMGVVNGYEYHVDMIIKDNKEVQCEFTRVKAENVEEKKVEIVEDDLIEKIHKITMCKKEIIKEHLNNNGEEYVKEKLEQFIYRSKKEDEPIKSGGFFRRMLEGEIDLRAEMQGRKGEDEKKKMSMKLKRWKEIVRHYKHEEYKGELEKLESDITEFYKEETKRADWRDWREFV